MTFLRLITRSLWHHRLTNVAVTLGIAAAVAVLAGALVVGDSVRGSLRDIALGRLGNTGDVIASAGFFRAQLADDVARASGRGAAPLIATTGIVTHEGSGKRASGVLVYGVDERFWRFHGLDVEEGVHISPSLAAELGAAAGDVLLARVQKPSEIPLESLFAQKEDIGRTLRLTLTAALPVSRLGEFALTPQQSEVRAIFAPLRRIQRDLGVATEVNTVLVADGQPAFDAAALRTAIRLEDLGLRVDTLPELSMVSVESASGILAEPVEAAARKAGEAAGLSPTPVFTYLANSIRKGDRVVPYSLISALDMYAPPGMPVATGDGIILNDWTARDLAAAVRDRIEIDYYLWDPAAGLQTRTATFTVQAVVPMEGIAADRRLAPEYPGITSAESLADWDPPFPVDLSRVRPIDDKYWQDFRTTPKAFISYARGKELWSTRYGAATSLRFSAPPAQDLASAGEKVRAALLQSLAPESLGVTVTPARRLALEASGGATDFGEYFTYFSFFIVVSALLLAILFFRLGIEQRLRQIGILRAAGFTLADVRKLLMVEAALLAIAGSVIGAIGAVIYAQIIVYGLRTWWVGAVGTTLLAVHVRPLTLIGGAVAGVIAALACVWFSLRTVGRRSPRSLLSAQSLDADVQVDVKKGRRARLVALALVVVAAALLIVAFVVRDAQAASFYGAGAALLVACLFYLSAWLRSRNPHPVTGQGTRAIARLGFRSAAFRPGRSVLSAALIASAAFIIVSVDAFRRGESELTADPKSGSGGFALIGESEVPLLYDPNTEAGREALMIQAPELSSVRFARFRMRQGDDASCLNLYRPTNPTIVAPEAGFLESNRFTFASSLAQSDAERANPWLLLDRTHDDGTIPVIADATSLQYVLHASVGDTFAVDTGGNAPVRLRFVAALRDSVLQGVLVTSEAHFLKLYPGEQGFRMFLVEAPGVTSPETAAALAGMVERELETFGVDVVSTADRLNAFHRVENTYLSTFQALGGLGLLLGTVGLATVMIRNVLERRRELALLRAVGYHRRAISVMILAEAILLLTAGLLAGAGSALVAIAPALVGRGGATPGIGLALLLGAVLVAGVLSSLAATSLAVRGDVLRALRAE